MASHHVAFDDWHLLLSMASSISIHITVYWWLFHFLLEMKSSWHGYATSCSFIHQQTEPLSFYMLVLSAKLSTSVLNISFGINLKGLIYDYKSVQCIFHSGCPGVNVLFKHSSDLIHNIIPWKNLEFLPLSH